jgi:hypothetical protein
MKLQIAVVGAMIGAFASHAFGLDPAWGKWTQKNDPGTAVEFTASNITVSVHGTQEVWTVVAGTNVVTGLTVRRGDTVLKAGCAVKFNEMFFHLGDRSWALRQGPKMDLGPGINAPLRMENGKTNAANKADEDRALKLADPRL